MLFGPRLTNASSDEIMAYSTSRPITGGRAMQVASGPSGPRRESSCLKRLIVDPGSSEIWSVPLVYITEFYTPLVICSVAQWNFGFHAVPISKISITVVVAFGPGMRWCKSITAAAQELMGQIRPGSAKTTHAIRGELQRSQTPVASLARQHGINEKTVLKERHRSSVEDMPKSPG